MLRLFSFPRLANALTLTTNARFDAHCRYDVPSAVDPATIGRAIDALVHRHPMLRALVDDDGRLRILPTDVVGCYEVPVLAPGAVGAERVRMLRNGPTTDVWPLFELALSFPREGGGKQGPCSLLLFVSFFFCCSYILLFAHPRRRWKDDEAARESFAFSYGRIYRNDLAL